MTSPSLARGGERLEDRPLALVRGPLGPVLLGAVLVVPPPGTLLGAVDDEIHPEHRHSLLGLGLGWSVVL